MGFHYIFLFFLVTTFYRGKKNRKRVFRWIHKKALEIILKSAFSSSETVDFTIYMSPLEETEGSQVIQSTVTIDGNKDQTFFSGACAKTVETNNPYWIAKFPSTVSVSNVSVWLPDDCCSEQFWNVTITVGEGDMTTLPHLTSSALCYWYQYSYEGTGTRLSFPCQMPLNGEYVVIQEHNEFGVMYLALCEVEITTGPLVSEVPTTRPVEQSLTNMPLSTETMSTTTEMALSADTGSPTTQLTSRTDTEISTVELSSNTDFASRMTEMPLNTDSMSSTTNLSSSTDSMSSTTELSSNTCFCFSNRSSVIHVAELTEKLGEIRTRLKLEKKSLKSHKMKLTSAPYKSTFSTTAGSVAIGVLVAVVMSILIFDLANIRSLRACL